MEEVYLTGVHTVKNPKKNNNPSDKEPIKILEKNKDIEKEKNDNINKDISLELNKKGGSETSNMNLKKSSQLLKKNLRNKSQEKDNNNNSNKNNNFISEDDLDESKKTKKNFLCIKDFSRMRHQSSENKKNNELMINELKEEYLEYIMLKEPKYADFDKISEDYRKKIYHNFQKYNNNLLVIARKKEEKEKILSQIEKSLINNYYLKDTSMLPIYEQLIEKLKIDILTKQQEHDGYKKIYEELYNKNFALRRKVLDEIEIDRSNENFYDQYKILKNHAVVQVSKKQDSLNQIEEYQKKMLEDHEKELKQKNKMLKDLKLEIEVFKEDEKDLINKLKKLKNKKEQVRRMVKDKEKKLREMESNYVDTIKRYQRSYISMNKIFKSVNAKNLDDVLVDVNSIKAKFNNLKNNIINLNQKISNLNSEHSNLNNELKDIQKHIISNKNKKYYFFNEEEQNRIIEIKNELKKNKENNLRMKEIIQNNIGSYQNGINFIFQKIKLFVTNINILNNIISPKLLELINKYKNTPFSVNYEKIDNEFLTNYTFLFFQFSNILSYLSLRSMTSEAKINNFSENMIIPICNKSSLNLYADGMRKTIKEYGRRSSLKIEKLKEINVKTIKKEVEQKIEENKLNLENKAVTQNQMFNRFIEYLHNKDSNMNTNRDKDNLYDNINVNNINNNKNSIFFTGIDSVKISHSKNNDNSSMSSLNYVESTNKINKDNNQKVLSFTIQQKEEFLKNNKNRVMNLFSRYQNSLVKENDKNIYYQKKNMKKTSNIRSVEITTRKPKIIKNDYVKENKEKNIQEENLKKKKLIPLDENYEYDEDDEEDEIKEKEKSILKKNKTYSQFSFFKLNKDRANIYKKMNDLRRLQMAYFGGRFLNTKISNGMSTSYGDNIFDEFVNNYYKRQNMLYHFQKNKNRKVDYGIKNVYEITANKKLRNKAVSADKIRNKNNKKINFKEKQLFKAKNNNMKTSFSINNRKTTMVSTRNNNNLYKKVKNSRNSSKVKKKNFRTFSVIKSKIKNNESIDKNNITNYYSKKK